MKRNTAVGAGDSLPGLPALCNYHAVNIITGNQLLEHVFRQVRRVLQHTPFHAGLAGAAAITSWLAETGVRGGQSVERDCETRKPLSEQGSQHSSVSRTARPPSQIALSTLPGCASPRSSQDPAQPLAGLRTPASSLPRAHHAGVSVHFSDVNMMTPPLWLTPFNFLTPLPSNSGSSSHSVMANWVPNDLASLGLSSSVSHCICATRKPFPSPSRPRVLLFACATSSP